MVVEVDVDEVVVVVVVCEAVIAMMQNAKIR